MKEMNENRRIGGDKKLRSLALYRAPRATKDFAVDDLRCEIFIKSLEEKMKKTQEIPPPEGLSEKARGLWLSVAGSRGSSPERLALLETGLKWLDRADEANRLIAEQGLICVTPRSGASHINPLVKIELQSRALFVKVWHELGLRFDPPKTAKLKDFKI